jgi:trans-2,3-dihydro-3-hydroxyanthranilate isomerase
VPFTCIALAGVRALTRVTVDRDVAAALAGEWGAQLYVFAPAGADGALRARMFAPALGIDEDPATGAAATALAGLLADGADDGLHQWRIDQGVEMGRPARLDLGFEVRDGAVARVALGGQCVIIGSGRIRAPGPDTNP